MSEIPCPKCLEKGERNPLNREKRDNEWVLVCKNGHIFYPYP